MVDFNFLITSRNQKSFLYIVLVGICALTFYLRLTFFGQYIDTDVGNMGYMGWRMSEGEVLLDIEGPGKPPLYPILYGLFIIFFGPSPIGIKWFGTVFILSSVIAIYWITKQIYEEKTGLLSSLLFGVFSSAPMVEGETVNLETIMHLPYILAIGFFIKGIISKKLRWYFIAGLFGSLTVLVKQVGGVIFFVFFLSEVFSNLKKKELFLRYIFIILGAILPFLGIIIFYFLYGYHLHELLDSMLISNLRYIRRGYEYTNFIKNFFGVMKLILRENSILWFGAIFSSFYICRKMIHHETRRLDRVVILWAIFSFLVLWISGTFYSHYFLQLIAPFSVLTAYAILIPWKLNISPSPQLRKIMKGIWIIILVSTSIIFLKTDYPYFFSFSPVEQTIYQIPSFGKRCIEYGVYNIVQNQIANYLKEQTKQDETIYIWGIAPQTYYLAQRRAASRYRNNFNLSEIVTEKPMEELRKYAPIVIKDIRRSKPIFIIEIIRLEDFPELQALVKKYYELDKAIEFFTPPYRISIYRRVKDIEES